jgi:hypothetical protein
LPGFRSQACLLRAAVGKQPLQSSEAVAHRLLQCALGTGSLSIEPTECCQTALQSSVLRLHSVKEKEVCIPRQTCHLCEFVSVKLCLCAFLLDSQVCCG